MTQTLSGPTTVSSARRRFSLLALALGGFGIGASEFTAMGVLPQLAADLLPALNAVSPEAAEAQTGWLISAYALGVVIGAPTLGVMLGRFPRKATILWLLAALAAGALLSAALPSFGLVFGARVFSGLPHGAFFGVAALAAGELMGPGKRGQGIALVLSGLTVANMVGVPLFTFLGQQFGWQVSYLFVAGIFLSSLLAVLLTLPPQQGDSSSTVRRELRAFRLPQVWLAIGIGAIGFGGLFSVYTYVAPMLINVTGQPEWIVPIALVVMGTGMTIGNLLGGWLSDRDVRRTILGSFAVMIIALVLLGSTLLWLPTALLGIFLVGAASSALSPSIQSRLMDVAHESRTLGAALNHASLNIGNALGAFAGGLGIAWYWGYTSPVWIGLALTAAGLVIAVISFGMDARAGAKSRGRF